MEIEELLRKTLHASTTQSRPRPGFEDRVHASLAGKPRLRLTGGRLLGGMVALMGVVALVVVSLPWFMGPPQAAVGPGGQKTPGFTETSPALASTPLAHAEKWLLSFDYPATWTVTDTQTLPATANHLREASAQRGVPRVFGFVGTAPGAQTCLPATATLKAPLCSTRWNLADGTISMRFGMGGLFDGGIAKTTYHWTAWDSDLGTVLPGAESLVIDNLPVRFVRSVGDRVPYSQETIPGASEVLWWGLPSQSGDAYQSGWEIVAAIAGPHASELEAQATALVDSIHFAPEPTLLPTDPGLLESARQSMLRTAYAAIVHDENDEHIHELDCFPTTVGASRQAYITQTIPTNPLTVPLLVTCSLVSMVPTPMQNWALTLSQTWAAGPDYPAGDATFVYFLNAQGQMYSGTSQGSGTTSDGKNEFTYPHVGTSKY